MKKTIYLTFSTFIVSLFLSANLFAQSKTLKVGTIQRPPFMMKDGGGNLSGFSIELWKEIALRLKVDTEFVEFNQFSEMTEATEKGEVTASIANISVTAKREILMDYSQPIYDSGLQILIPAEKGKLSYLSIIWDSGILKFLLFALGILLIIAHVLWFFERNVVDARHDYFRDDYRGGIWDAFWWAFIVMTMGGFENEVPHKVISRILAMVWIVASVFFISTLTAKITTALTVSELQTSINSVRDLRNKRVGISKGPTARDYLANKGVKVYKEYDDLEALLADLKNGELDAVVQDAPILQYYAAHDGKGKVSLAGDIFKPENYAILFPQHSPLREDVNRVLLSIYEDGTHRRLLEKYFGSK